MATNDDKEPPYRYLTREELKARVYNAKFFSQQPAVFDNPRLALHSRFTREGLSHRDGVYDGLDLNGIIAPHAYLDCVDIPRASLVRADLSEADCCTSSFVQVDFTDANLTEANFSMAALNFAILAGANLHKSLLVGSSTIHASFRGANLTGANLAGCLLIGADFSDADLTGANLEGATMMRVNLTRAILTGANLSCAGLDGAYVFETVGLTDLQLHDASFKNLVDGSLARKWNPYNEEGE